MLSLAIFILLNCLVLNTVQAGHFIENLGTLGGNFNGTMTDLGTFIGSTCDTGLISVSSSLCVELSETQPSMATSTGTTSSESAPENKLLTFLAKQNRDLNACLGNSPVTSTNNANSGTSTSSGYSDQASRYRASNLGSCFLHAGHVFLRTVPVGGGFRPPRLSKSNS